MIVARSWDCTAYGKQPDSIPEPLCFFGATKACLSHLECQLSMNAERKRVFARIQEMAAAGDEVSIDLAETFTSPDQLLNADNPEEGE